MERSALENMVTAAQRNIEARKELDDQAKDVVKQALDDVKQLNVEVPNTQVPNTQVYLIAVGAVAGIAGVIVVASLLIIGFTAKTDIPEFLKLALATALGALAGMLVPTAKAGRPPS